MKPTLIVRDISESMGKLPPQAIDLEEAVIGAILMEKRCFSEVQPILSADDFYLESHKQIFLACAELHSANLNMDMRSVVAQLRKRGQLELVGGAYYVAELNAKVSSSASIMQHARIIKEHSIKRELIQIASSIHHSAYEDTTDVFELLDEAKAKIQATDQNLVGGIAFQTIGQQLQIVAKQIQDRTGSESLITGVVSGLYNLDRITSGWQPTDLIILAARPGMGKSALLSTVLQNAAKRKVPAALFSLEMSSLQITQRAAATESEIGLTTIRTKKLSDFEYSKFISKTAELATMPLYLDDTPGLHVNELRTRARKLVAEHGVGIIGVDYIQLMRGDKDKNGNRENEISSISRMLKLIAKELGVPVIALSQLSRSVETRGGQKRPILSDLRESGAIEQDADIVIFLYRPEYYDIKFDEDGNSTQGLAEAIIAKHRSGPTLTVKLKFKGHTTTFLDWIEHDKPKEEMATQKPVPTQFPKAVDDDAPF